MTRYASNVDLNQKEIVRALRDAHYQVVLMHTVGGGFPDLIACRGGVAHFVEVKGRRGRLNETQRRFHDEWRGPQIKVVRSIEEALEAVGAR